VQPPDSTPTDTTTPPDTTGPVPSFAVELLVDGLESPLYVTAAPGDDARLYVLEKSGRIRIVRNGVLLDEPFLDISGSTSDQSEQGLLGLAFHPDYASNGQVFVDHTGEDGATRIVRYTASSPDELDPTSEELLLEIPQPFSNHNGGQIAFGPDGMLYIGLGDGGGGGDPDGNGQNRRSLLGSILRIDVGSGPGYDVPPDNPFAPPLRAEIWAYGLRNPWRFSFDRSTGDLYVADVGQRRFEEVTVVPAGTAGGLNFGWNVLEGSGCYEADSCNSAGMLAPVYEYEHPDGCSITGGYVYRGTAIPDLRGRYLFADYCEGWVRSFVNLSGSAAGVGDHSGLPDLVRIVSFGEDNQGELYLVSLDGPVYRIVPED
jgi:glucose/arabinose dehydrogenase